jgi:hypothetical protein
MKKKLIVFIIAVAVVFSALPVSVSAASNVNVNDRAVVYTPWSDYKSGDCILTSSRNMIRRAAILRGSKIWSKTTNKTLRGKATIFGLLLHNFTYSTDGLAYTVKMGMFKGNTEKERIKEFERLIKEHPEGVVVWGKRASIYGEHGVLLTGVKNGVPYAADSAFNIGSSNRGIMKWKDTSMYSPVRCTQYWYIKSVSLASGAKAPAKGKPLKPTSAGNVNTASTLKISDANKPTSVTVGNPYSISGVIESNYRINKVTVSIINSNNKAVISQSATPKTWVYNLSAIDARVKFGTLATGTYTYKVTAKDEKKTSTLVSGKFTVKPKPKSALKLTYYNAPTSIKYGNPFSIKGKVTSNKIIKTVVVQVVDKNGKVHQGATSNVNKRSFNIKSVDLKIRFGKLAKGTYKYQVIATDTAQKKTLLNKAFTVK